VDEWMIISDNEKNIDFNELEYEFSLKSHADASLADYVLQFHGSIKLWDDEALDEISIGDISGYRINFHVLKVENLDFADLLEQISHEVAEFSRKAELTCEPGQDRCHCMVYVTEINIDPAFRNQGLGSSLLNRIPKMLDIHNCIIALKAFPISYDYAGRPSQNAIQQVKNFYSRQGFVPVGGEYMSKPCSSL
jgi:GNAT superfamily N-acetyltransferase